MVFFMRFNFLKIILNVGYEVLWGFFYCFFLEVVGVFCFGIFFLETETNLVFDTEVLKDRCV